MKAAFAWAALWMLGCGRGEGARPPVEETALSAPSSPQRACSLGAGAWSPSVDGLRGRMVTSRGADGGLRVAVEIEPASGAAPVEIHWVGRPVLGFAEARVIDARGAEVSEPDFRLPGNEHTGNMIEVVSGRVERELAGSLFTTVGGQRVVRIGAFWARVVPAESGGVKLGARLMGHEPATDELILERDTVRPFAAGDRRGRVFRGPLDLPPVCIE